MKFKILSLTIFAAAASISIAAIGCSLSESMSVPESAPVTAAATAGVKTLENLQTAFNGESNAQAKYLAFAKKADDEGYTKVASLFRAAARSEEIHKTNHAEVIKKMGGVPTADVKVAEVKTTAENLKAAIDGESYERDTMYPEFLTEARDSRNTDAVRTFNFAKAAESEHAKLYAEALANMEAWKGGATTFLVCPKCGYTTSNAKIEKCPVDFTPNEKFESIS